MADEQLQGDIRPYATEDDVISMVYDLYGMKVNNLLKARKHPD